MSINETHDRSPLEPCTEEYRKNDAIRPAVGERNGWSETAGSVNMRRSPRVRSSRAWLPVMLFPVTLSVAYAVSGSAVSSYAQTAAVGPQVFTTRVGPFTGGGSAGPCANDAGVCGQDSAAFAVGPLDTDDADKTVVTFGDTEFFAINATHRKQLSNTLATVRGSSLTAVSADAPNLEYKTDRRCSRSNEACPTNGDCDGGSCESRAKLMLDPQTLTTPSFAVWLQGPFFIGSDLFSYYLRVPVAWGPGDNVDGVGLAHYDRDTELFKDVATFEMCARCGQSELDQACVEGANQLLANSTRQPVREGDYLYLFPALQDGNVKQVRVSLPPGGSPEAIVAALSGPCNYSYRTASGWSNDLSDWDSALTIFSNSTSPDVSRNAYLADAQHPGAGGLWMATSSASEEAGGVSWLWNQIVYRTSNSLEDAWSEPRVLYAPPADQVDCSSAGIWRKTPDDKYALTSEDPCSPVSCDFPACKVQGDGGLAYNAARPQVYDRQDDAHPSDENGQTFFMTASTSHLSRTAFKYDDWDTDYNVSVYESHFRSARSTFRPVLPEDDASQKRRTTGVSQRPKIATRNGVKLRRPSSMHVTEVGTMLVGNTFYCSDGSVPKYAKLHIPLSKLWNRGFLTLTLHVALGNPNPEVPHFSQKLTPDIEMLVAAGHDASPPRGAFDFDVDVDDGCSEITIQHAGLLAMLDDIQRVNSRFVGTETGSRWINGWRAGWENRIPLFLKRSDDNGAPLSVSSVEQREGIYLETCDGECEGWDIPGPDQKGTCQ